MKKKGRLQVGADTDVVVFDLETILDYGTCLEPAKLSASFRHLTVNGTTIIDECKRQGAALPGQPKQPQIVKKQNVPVCQPLAIPPGENSAETPVLVSLHQFAVHSCL